MRWPTHISPTLLAATAVVVVGVAPAVAQQDTSEFQPARLPGWTFTPGIVGSLVFDSNVALVPEATTPVERPSDQLFVVEPSGQLEFIGPRTTFESGYRGYVRRYTDLNELNGFDQRAYASIRHRATRRTTIYANESFREVPSTDELELNGAPFLRVGSRNNTLAAGLESRLTREMDLNVRYDLSWVDFNQTQSLLVHNGLFHGVAAELLRHVNDRASAGGEYSIRVAHLDEGTRDLTFHNAGGTVRYDPGPRTSIHAGAGVAYLIDHLLNETHVGPYVRAEITHHLQRATTGASFAREFIPTFGFGGSSQSEAFHAFVAMPVNRNRMYLQESLSWRRTNPLIVSSTPLDSWWLNSTVGYGFSRWMRLQGFYSYARQDTNLQNPLIAGLVKRHRIGAEIVIAQPMRIP